MVHESNGIGECVEEVERLVVDNGPGFRALLMLVMAPTGSNMWRSAAGPGRVMSGGAQRWTSLVMTVTGQ